MHGEMGVHREDDGKEDDQGGDLGGDSGDGQAPVCAATSARGAGIIRG
jgi:hypothetical protein